jgi:hypothetical protein
MSDEPQSSDARAGYGPLLAELVELYPELKHDLPPYRSSHNQVRHLAHGWYLRCHRGIEAILQLDQTGYAEEVAPLRRSVIEHVLALRWLAAEGNRILDTVARGHAADAQRRGEAVSAAGWTSIDLAQIEQVIAEIDPDSRDPGNDHLLTFAHRLAAYGDMHTRPGYLAECARTHPSYESAICYVRLTDGTPLPRSRDAVWQVPFSTTHLLEALLAIQHVYDPEPWHPRLDDIVTSYCQVTDDVRIQDGLPTVDWSPGKLHD